MKRPGTAFVFSALIGACQAQAAEFPPLPQQPVTSPTVYETAASNQWGGLYVGVNGGGGFGSSQWSINGIGTSIFDTDGFLFGGTLGVNFPISEVLVGLEGDVDWSTLNGSSPACAVNTGGAAAACETKNDWLGTARARFGYALDRTLIFVSGGAAFGGVQTGLAPPSTFDTGVRIGWSAGTGAEFAFARNWTAKAEYLFVDLGRSTCATTANCGSAAGASVVLTENLIRAGVNYKFSW